MQTALPESRSDVTTAIDSDTQPAAIGAGKSVSTIITHTFLEPGLTNDSGLHKTRHNLAIKKIFTAG